MGTKTDQIREWILNSRMPRTPQDEAALMHAAEAFDRATETGVLTDADLAAVVEPSSHPGAIQWKNTIGMLGALSEKHANAANAILQMSASNRVSVRMAAVLALRNSTPLNIIGSVLRTSLCGKSKKLRIEAAFVACRLNHREVMDEVRMAGDLELNPKDKKSIQLALDLLRDGHQVHSDSSGNWFITVRTADSRITRRMTEQEVEAANPTSIADSIRAEHQRLFGV